MKLSKEYNLAALYPEIAKQWHPTKNGDLTPDKITPGSGKKVWWICKKGHEWQVGIMRRTDGGSACHYCTNQKVGYGNDLESKFPEIAKQWHPTKNGDSLPSHFLPGTNTKVWWLCDKGHEWPARISSRTGPLQKSGCPKCTSQTSIPELYIFSEMLSIFNRVEHRKKIENIEIDVFINDLNLGIEYDGYFFHKKQVEKDLIKRRKLSKKYEMINIREYPLKVITDKDIVWNSSDDLQLLVIKILKYIQNSKLDLKNFEKDIAQYLKEEVQRNKIFFNKMVSYLPGPLPGNSLEDKYPKMAKQWHPTKNGDLTPNNFSYASTWKAWWQCDEGHEWQVGIARRTDRGSSGCPYCTNQKVGYGNDLESKFPEIAKQWHPTRNGDLTPGKITSGSAKKVWWICKEGHSYQRIVHLRTAKNYGCPYCINRKVGYGNDLQTKFPEIAKEWHTKRNGDSLPSHFLAGNNTKVWWMCEKGHKWSARISSRTGPTKSGCSICSYNVVKKGNDLESHFPDIAKQWHPTKNGDLLPNEVAQKSNKKVWWKCKKEHEWQAQINSRTNGRGCRKCSNENYERSFIVYKNGKEVGIWNSQVKCSKELGFQYPGNISACLNKKRRSHKGYNFVYQEKNDT
jgi:hypothetical protein